MKIRRVKNWEGEPLNRIAFGEFNQTFTPDVSEYDVPVRIAEEAITYGEFELALARERTTKGDK